MRIFGLSSSQKGKPCELGPESGEEGRQSLASWAERKKTRAWDGGIRKRG